MIRKYGGKRNYGWGRSMKHAAKNAIRDRYGNGRFSTRHTTVQRIGSFIAFIKKIGIRDYQAVSREVVEAYGRQLGIRVAAGQLAVATAVNRLSAVNVLMAHMRSDQSVSISPRELIGSRVQVRRDVPFGMDKSIVDDFARFLEEQNEVGLATMLRLCLTLGLRHKEAALLPIADAFRQARESGQVEVRFGTKGGRTRIVDATETTTEMLKSAAKVYPHGNMIPQTWSYIKWSRYCYRVFVKHASGFGLGFTFHDLRAAFGCRLYECETGAPAPVLTGGRRIDSVTDRKARLRIAEALGHSRPQAAGPYVGTSLAAEE